MRDHTTDWADIDVADIWQDQQESFRVGEFSEDEFEQRCLYLTHFYLLKKHNPFISDQLVAADPSLGPYYENYRQRLAAEKNSPSRDFFEHGGAFYDTNESCVIERNDVSPGDFARLFALRLQGMKADTKKASSFLLSHFEKSFQKDFSAYDAFLSTLPGDFLAPAVRDGTLWWRATTEAFLKTGWTADGNITVEVSPLDDFTAEAGEFSDTQEVTNAVEAENEQQPELLNPSETAEEVQTAPPVAIPIPNPNGWTPEEINHFFSFLYKERGQGEGSFLTLQQVECLLQNDIEIPEQPLKEKYRLHTTGRYPKTIAHAFFFAFIAAYNPNRKKHILQFLGSYLEDYANALDPKTYQNAGGNMKRRKVTNKHFKIKDYLPARFSNLVHQ